MMLQALHDYYLRKSADSDAHIAPAGFEWKEIPFIIELDRNGQPVQIETTQDGKGRQGSARSFLVPQGVKKTANVEANLLWENAEYVLSLPNSKKLAEQRAKGKEVEYRARLVSAKTAFVDAIRALPPAVQQDFGILAVLRFLDKPGLSILERFPAWTQIVQFSPNLSFRLHGDMDLVCQRPAVVAALQADQGHAQANGICLITGESDEIERLHDPIKGVWGAQTSGANIVSFNLPAFISHGKSQGENAPVGKRAAQRYTKALNHLLVRNSTQRIQVGDASTVFWAEKSSAFESRVVDIFGEAPKDDPDRGARAVKSLYKAIENGAFERDEGKTQFYVLGLAPNAARIAIRFWYVSTVTELATHIREHFDDLEIVRPIFERPHLSLFRLLVSTAAQGKAENIPPSLGGDVIRCILAGTPYPQTLLQAVVRRIRAEQSKKDNKQGKALPHVTYPRAALIKAYINRQIRHSNSHEKEIAVSLDKTNINVGYRLGRLFAALEHIQEDASGGKLNSTIRDRFYGAASSIPGTVFTTLLRLNKHHMTSLRKEKPLFFVARDKLVGEIMNEGLDGRLGFPPILNLQDQGRFAIGYYHQRQDFYKQTKSAKLDQGE
ncbi:MAG: type I-C CRISPR-associated protein Cas8c/Csd1 [Nitrosospira sp.]|nr:type I-C CRISPR-associated protein Cas8c/Csd1 [Nitrosospira sp.]MDN5934680.1 type I-C CRISPR-associated protein Cas8c/Csd1 [Nitrosospira sp.]